MSATPRCEPLRELVWTPDGARTPEEEALLRAHLAECAECRAAAESARRVAASLAALPTVAAPKTLRERTLAELDARRAAAAATAGTTPTTVNGAAPSLAPPPSLDARRRRSLPIALRVALPLAATLTLAIVWWQSYLGDALPLADRAAPTGSEGESGELLALAPSATPVEKAADPPPVAETAVEASDAGVAGAPATDPVTAGDDRSGLASDVKGETKDADGPGAPAGAPIAGSRGEGRTRGVGAPPGAPPPPGAAAAPQEEQEKNVDPRSAALLAAATPADALQLIERERAAWYGAVERQAEQERRKEPEHKEAPKEPPLDKGGGGGGGETGSEKKYAALDELRATHDELPSAPTELRYAEWTPASPREQELLAEWSRRGAREGDLLVIDLAPEELEATRESRDGFIDFADDGERMLVPVDDPERWWKATWRAAEVVKLKSAAKSGEAKSGDPKSGEVPTGGAAKGDAPARPTAADSSRGQNKRAAESDAPPAEPAAKPKARADEDKERADRDEEARAAKARRVRVVVRLTGS